MAWAAGNFTRANGANEWQDDAALGIGIEPGVHDAQDNDLATGIDQCLNKTGQNSMTGNLNVGGNRVTNVASGTAAAPAICAGNDVDTGIYSPAANEIGIATNGAERIRIDSAGKVGIDSTSPDAKLAIGAQINGSGYALKINTDTRTTGEGYVWLGDAAAPDFFINTTGYVGVGISSPTVPLHVRRDANDTLTRVRIHNNNNQSTAESGFVLGNDASADGAGIILCSTSNTSRAGVNSLNILNGLAAPIRVQAGGSGGVDLASGGTSWSPVSDQRLKKNIKPLTYGLAQISQVQSVRFDYVDDVSNDSKRIGFIAQQLQPIVPEAVWGSEDTHFRASSTELIPVLVNAIKELSAKVEALEAQVQTLQPDTVLG